MGRKALKKYVNEDGVPWLMIAEAKGISEYRFQKRLEEGYSPEEAADLAKEQYPSMDLLEEMAAKLTERRYWESWVE